MKKMLYIFSFLMLSSDSVFAVDIPHAMKQTMTHGAGMPSLLNLVVSMMLVIGLIYATGWVYSKLNVINRDKLNKIVSGSDDDFKFTVLQSMPLGQQRNLYSIKMQNKILLVGSTPSHINLLKEFDFEAVQEVEVTKSEKVVSSIESDVETRSVNIDELYKKYKN